jgi:hypothetical protein
MNTENNQMDLDADQELNELEQKIGKVLDEYDVEYPSETEIMASINAVMPFVKIKENKWKKSYEILSSIFKQSLNEVFYVSPLFWISNTLLLLIGLLAVLSSETNPYLIILLLAPIPTITGLAEVFKSRNAKMAELEMSFKYSLQEIILSKMVVVGVFNMFINIILTLLITMFNQNVLLWKLVLHWLTPFTVISAIALVIVSRFRSLYIVTVGIVFWITFGTVLAQSNISEKLVGMSTGIYVAITFISIITIIIQAKQIYKRGIKYEFNH